MSELMTRKEFASFFGVTPGTIRNWEKKGVVTPTCVVNGRPRYSREFVERLLVEIYDFGQENNK